MKKSAVVLCAFAALCICGIAVMHARLVGTADEVAFRETALYGDVDAANGLTLTARQSCNRQLYWTSAVPVAAPALARTEFWAKDRQTPLDGWYSTEGIRIYSVIGGGGYNFGSGGASDDVVLERIRESFWYMDSDGYTAMLRAAMDRTAADEYHEETFRVRDYMEYYPLMVDLDLGGGVMLWWRGEPYVPGTDDTSGLGDYIAEAFRIPAPENAMLTVKVTKDARGMISSLYTESDPDAIALETQCVVTEDKCWFTLRRYGEERFDFSELRKGYGLYSLPFAMRTEPDKFGNKAADLDTDVMHVALPFAEDETPLELFDAGEGTLLLLLRSEKEGLALVVLDTETERVRQRLVLPGSGELGEEGWNVTPFDGGRLFMICEKCVRYYERGADGRYALLLDAPYGVDGGAQTGGDSLRWSELERYGCVTMDSPAAVAWDGERLAAAVTSYAGFDRDYQLGQGGLLLTVFDASGVRYCAFLESGVMRAEEGEYDYRVMWGDREKLAFWDVENAPGVALAFDGQWSAEKTALHQGVDYAPKRQAASHSAIIGGADGETAIFVAGETNGIAVAAAIVAAVLAALFVLFVVKKRKKA